jgi:selenium metabolism protein YedF
MDDFMAQIEAGRPVLFVPSDRLGDGPEELGEILMRAALKTALTLDPAPAAVLFMNSGVKLACEGSVLLDDLRRLEAAGAALLSCGTCLDFYHLKEKLEVGRGSNMKEILTTMATAPRLVRL